MPNYKVISTPRVLYRQIIPYPLPYYGSYHHHSAPNVSDSNSNADEDAQQIKQERKYRAMAGVAVTRDGQVATQAFRETSDNGVQPYDRSLAKVQLDQIGGEISDPVKRREFRQQYFAHQEAMRKKDSDLKALQQKMDRRRAELNS